MDAIERPVQTAEMSPSTRPSSGVMERASSRDVPPRPRSARRSTPSPDTGSRRSSSTWRSSAARRCRRRSRRSGPGDPRGGRRSRPDYGGGIGDATTWPIPIRRSGRRGPSASQALIAAAPGLGTRVVTLCTGSRDPEDMWRAHPDNSSPEAWRDSLEQIAAALAVAERCDVVLAFEPEHNNVVADAAAGRRLLDELAIRPPESRSRRRQSDPAGRARPGSTRPSARRSRCLATRSSWRTPRTSATTARSWPPGRGGLDYALYVELLRDAGYTGPLVLHGLSEDEVPEAVRFVRAHLGVGARAEPDAPRPERTRVLISAGWLATARAPHRRGAARRRQGLRRRPPRSSRPHAAAHRGALEHADRGSRSEQIRVRDTGPRPMSGGGGGARLAACLASWFTTATSPTSAASPSRRSEGPGARSVTAPRSPPAPYGEHAIWWAVDAADEQQALRCLPFFIAQRSTVTQRRRFVIP